jgi:diaminopimelate epimerase
MKKLDWFNLTVCGTGTSAVVLPVISSASTFPLSTGTVTVHFDTGTSTGFWKAEGL